MSSSPSKIASDHFEKLLEAARSGDKEAQGRLLEGCRRPLLWFARREIHPNIQGKGSASEVVQETFLKALREIDTFQGCTPEQLLAWLRVILQHTLSNFQREFHTEKREITREVSGQTVIVREDPRHAAPSASDKAISNEQARLVQQALERLPIHYAEVLRLRHYENLSFEEIGERTGRTTDAARKLWRRAVSAIGRRLEV